MDSVCLLLIAMGSERYASCLPSYQEAEITASVNSASSRSVDIAQKRGSAILNLKCTDAQVLNTYLIDFLSLNPSIFFFSVDFIELYVLLISLTLDRANGKSSS